MPQTIGGAPLPALCDLVVVGSGAAGLVAAAAAARNGLAVVVVEKSSLLGGTSAVSAGTVWIPLNSQMAAYGIHDDASNARAYLVASTRGSTPVEILDRVVEGGSPMLEFITSCGVHLEVSETYPDYRPDLPGALAGGRSMQPGLYESTRLGTLRPLLRRDENQLPYTMREFKQWGSWERFPWGELETRAERGLVARGAAIVGPLLEECLRQGVTFATETAAQALLTDGDAVRGIETSWGSIEASKGVVLACGGFEWDEEMVATHLSSRITARCSPPHNTGDGHRMAEAVDADLANMDQAWWAPMIRLPGVTIDGRQVGRHIRTERQGPGTLLVDRHGQRFVNESQDYNSLIRRVHEAENDSPAGRLPMHVVFDQRFLERFGFATHRSGQPAPSWLHHAPDVPGVAKQIGVDPTTLEATLVRFNKQAVRGEDDDFARGNNPYDRYGGDPDNPWPNPTLAPLDTPPYYAVRVETGAFGTCGGIKTDNYARALDSSGDVIDGLFAVGNVSSHPSAGGYPGAGATLGPGMTMGFVAGITAATKGDAA